VEAAGLVKRVHHRGTEDTEKAEGRRQKAESRRQKAESREQKNQGSN
jgi:hypothetical protein